MTQYILILWQICLFKCDQRKLPYSWVWLGFTAAIYGAFQFYLYYKFVFNLSAAELMLRVFGMLGMLSITLTFLLMMMKYQSRLHKTLMAIWGTGLIFSGLQIMTVSFLAANQLLSFFLYFWMLIVRMYILKNTLESSWIKAVFLGLMLQFFEELALVVGHNWIEIQKQI